MQDDIIVPDIIENIDESDTIINLADAIKIKQIIDDYQQLRNVVLSNLIDIKNLSDEVKKELEFEFDSKLVDSWNALTKTSNESLKILTESYKNISSVILSINKINSLNPKPQNEDTKIKIENTAEIIKRLKNSQSEK